MAGGNPSALYTIPAHTPFLPALAAGLWQSAGQDPFKLSSMRLLLPTRRACRLLREQFAPATGLKAMLLPQMQPLGDIGEDDSDGDGTTGYLSDPDLAARIAAIPPAIAPLRRRLLLAQLVMRRDAALGHDQAYGLAGALATLIDEVQIAGRGFDALAQLVSDDLARHWQETLAFLDIVTHHWPDILAAEGCLDPADRRNRIIAAQISLWQEKPPALPVIAAGSTGSVPATADLLRAVSRLPQGMVVLPGLDLASDEAAWGAIDTQHPQHAMKNFLEHCGAKRAEVRVWPACEETRGARALLLREAMRPAAVTDAWRDLRPEQLPRESLSCIERLTLDHTQEEAAVIALRLRAHLEDSAQTALFVTADRDLAERVSALLARWSVVADDSAGRPLTAMPVGVYLLLLLDAALAVDEPETGAVALLSLLKHPLSACGMETADCRAATRRLERATWRDGQPPQAAQLDFLSALLAPMTKNKTPRSLIDWLALHRQIAERIADAPTLAGAARLWRGDDGMAAAAWFDRAQAAAIDYPALTLAAYRGLCARFLRETPCRTSFGRHPRLAILGPLEARLMQADLTIIGGLNEGLWPPAPPVDPWMSRPMKQQFGLLSPEVRVGLSAHDFVQLSSAGQVLLTRAKRAGHAPTVPSRFWLQMDAVLQAAGHDDVTRRDPLAPAQPWRVWTTLLDAPAGQQKPAAPPAPRPPLSARPQSLSVTRIGVWLRNPYALYADKILRLKKLKPLQKEWEAVDRGVLFHRILQYFTNAHLTHLPPDMHQALCDEARRVFEEERLPDDVRLFWWPRFESMARWFAQQEAIHRADGYQPRLIEKDGSIQITTESGHRLELVGKADRIDRNAAGHGAIIDYKTGEVPKVKDVESGLEPQLSLLALILARGGFGDNGEAAMLAYWPVTGTRGEKKISVFPRAGKNAKPLSALLAEAEAGLRGLIDAYADPAMPYLAVPRPGIAPAYNDYAHLSRLMEWGRGAGGDAS